MSDANSFRPSDTCRMNCGLANQDILIVSILRRVVDDPSRQPVKVNRLRNGLAYRAPLAIALVAGDLRCIELPTKSPKTITRRGACRIHGY